MKSKKVLAGILSVSVLSIYPLIGAYANPLQAADLPSAEIIPISMPIKQASYLSFSGTVKEIEVRQPAGSADLKYVFVESEEGQEAYLVLSEDTYILNENELKAGSKITGFYDATKPMLMIYPPQYRVEVAVVNSEENIKVDFFDQNLVSSDGMLKLNVSDETEIITQDGDTYQGDLGEQKLAVLFGVSTKSIPAQTNPTKVIVLENSLGNDKEKPLPVEKVELRDLEILINNNKVQTPSAYLNSDGVTMVPLRAVAEKLDLKVTWNKDLQQVTLNNNISLTIGQDKYIGPNSTTVSLGTAPELNNGTAFVPFDFFSKVLGMASASAVEGKISINK